MTTAPPGLVAALQDRYHLQRELGQGGMATVYLAHDLKHGRDVAVKVLRPELGAILGAERFLAEIRTTAQLQHPHILPLFDSGEAEGFLYYVMPLAVGETLRDRLTRETQLPLDYALELAAQVASALDYAHKRGVIHRDIKPENILLAEGAAMLADFGIALAVRQADGQRMTETGLSLGTPQYMSPEQAAGERTLDGRSDVYSLGAVVYEMLAGEPPFRGVTAQAVIAKLMIERPTPLTTVRPQLPPGLDPVVQRALAKVPADRQATAGAFAAELRTPPSIPKAPAQHSIAVLPFANMSTEPDNEFFADGIAEEIINALTKLPGLRVAARTSAFSFKGKNEDLRSIGEKLNVKNLLEGSVRKAGNRLRITAQLINVDDGFHAWSERYDRELHDVFAIQDEIAAAIVDRLKLSLGDPIGTLVQPGTESVGAYQLYLKGRALMYRRGLNIDKARECFAQALALDSGYALAHAGLADALVYLAMWGVRPAREVIPDAKLAVRRALDLDPDLAEAHYALACISHFHDFDPETFTREFARAVEVKPSYIQARCGRALYDLCYYRLDLDAAAAETGRAVLDDPLSAYAATIHAMVLYRGGQVAEGLTQARRATELDADSVAAWWHLQCLSGWSGDHAASVHAAEKALALYPAFGWAQGTLAAEYGRAGNGAAAQAVYDGMMRQAAGGYVQPTWLGVAAVGCHRLEEALAHLLHAATEPDGILPNLATSWPDLDPLRETPEFADILRRMRHD